MRRSTSAAIAALLLIGALALLAGCGSSSDESETHTVVNPSPPARTSTSPGGLAKACPGGDRLRVSQLSCTEGHKIAVAWRGNPKCSSPAGASRYSCKAVGLTCLGATADAGIVVTCAGPGRSVSFISHPE
jgi:hypothetical protein